MNNPIAFGEAAASSLKLTLAIGGDKLTSAGNRLKAFSPSRSSLTPGALVAAALVLSMRPANAQVTAGGAGSLDSFLTNVVNLITGTTGTAIAIIAVALCGLGAMFGALSARALGGVVLGCGIVFSAAWVVGKITGSGT